MKRCPTCQRTYADDSLRFCLQDGAVLLSVGDTLSPDDPHATLALSETIANRDAPQAEMADPRAAPTAETLAAASPTSPQLRAATHVSQDVAPANRSSNRALTIGVIAIAVLLLTLVGIRFVMLMRGSSEGRRSRATADSNTSINSSPETTNNNVAVPLKIKATASSTRSPFRGIGYSPANVLDANPGTAWLEGATGPGIGEWIRCDFDREIKLRRILIAPGYFKSPQVWAKNNRLAAATIYFSDGSSRQFRFPDRMEEQRLETGGIKTAWVRLVINEVYFGTDPDTAISQLAFDWE